MNDITEILKLIDGTLNVDEQKMLFEDLAYDKYLRSEFINHLNIEKNISERNDLFLPPAESTAKIFKTAGIILPYSSGFFSNLLRYFNSFNPILSAALASIFTALVLLLCLWIFDNKNDTLEYQYSINNKLSELSNGNNSVTNLNPLPKILMKNNFGFREMPKDTIIRYVFISKNANDLSNEIGVLTKLDTIVNYIYITKIEENEKNSFASNPKNIDFSKINYEKVAITDKNIFSDLKNENSSGIEFSNIDIYQPIGITIEIKGSSYWNIPYTSIQPDRYMNFRNTGLSILYSISDKFKTGGDIRQETFFQRFEDSVYKYEQQPNFVTACLGLRYCPFEVGKIYPFTQASFGFNKAGFVARPMIGFEFKPYYDLSFILGFEYSLLFFQQDDKYFGAHKIGLNYGVSYCF